MFKRDRQVLACTQVADLRDPDPLSVRGHFCSLCHSEVWVMRTNLGHGLEIVCYRCCPSLIQEAQAHQEPIQVQPASALHREN